MKKLLLILAISTFNFSFAQFRIGNSDRQKVEIFELQGVNLNFRIENDVLRTVDLSGLVGGITDGNKGDITVSSSGAIWTMNSDAVTGAILGDNSVSQSKIVDGVISNSKLTHIVNSTMKGRVSTGSGAVEDLNAAQIRGLLNIEESAKDDQNISGSGLSGTDLTIGIDGGTNEVVDLSSLGLLGEITANTTRTAVLTDETGLIGVDNASAVTYTVPTNAIVAFPIGTILMLKQKGVGSILIVYSATVTGEDARTFGINQILTLHKTGTNTWDVINRPANVTLTAVAYTALSTSLKNNGTAYHVVN